MTSPSSTKRAATGLPPGPAVRTVPTAPPPGTVFPVPPQAGLSPGRCGTASPAGGPAPSCAPPAGPRVFTLELPPGLALLSLNSRFHWAENNRRAQALKNATWAMALSRKLPRLERVSLIVEYQPPDKRHRDADNAATASGKPCIDGLVAAGVLHDDECPRYVTGVTYTVGNRYPRGRLVLHITEIPGGDS